jgi:hypothetical protein
MHDRVIQFIALSVCGAALAAAGTLAVSISRERQENELVVSLEDSRGMPPHVALATAALGTFRGLAVDALWIRAGRLEEAGQYFEAQTLSQWITALQPRFPRVWAFQAWNLAYNISVTTSVPEERWNWVHRGMELLRTRAIPLNPHDADLPMELGWIYFHKIGSKTDREHSYYKAKLAREFRELYGDPAGDGTTQQVIERFRVIVNAADSLDELRRDRDVADAIELLEAHGAAPDEAFLRMLGRAILYGASVDVRIRLGTELPKGTNRPLVAALQADERLQKAVFQKIVPCLQKQVLVERYRMEPDIMLELMEKFGPLDWAHPHAHGIYWSERSIAIARANRHRERINELTVVRTRLGNTQHLMRSGRIEFDPLNNRIDILPDPRFIDSYEAGMRDAIQMIESDKGLSAAEFGRATVEDLLGGYESFLNQATVFAYLYGDEQKATECYLKICQIARESGRGDDPVFAGGLEQFLVVKMADVMEIDVANRRQFLDAMIQRALLDGLAKGRQDTFSRFVRIAKSVYERESGVEGGRSVHVNKEGRLPPFPAIVDASFENVMRQQSMSLLVRARIWAYAPEALRERAWPKIGETLTLQAEAAGFDPARAFPVPPGVKPKGDGDEAGSETEPATPTTSGTS